MRTRDGRVTVECHDTRRYSSELEAAVYFCCVEALGHAERRNAAVEIVVAESGGRLRFGLSCEGGVFDPEAPDFKHRLREMADGMEALGGELRAEPSITGGTAVSAAVPL